MTSDQNSQGEGSLDHRFVLIVDDRSAARRLLIALVGPIADGITVTAEGFAEPRKAMERAIEKTPDLIITDYQMPGMNGIEFTEHLRSIPELIDTPIIMITMSEDREVRTRALNAGVSDFLTRPIDPIDCKTRCRNLLLHRCAQKYVPMPDLASMREEVRVAFAN